MTQPARWWIRLRVAEIGTEIGTEIGALRPILIIGIGNTLRRDDGAGWFFAEALAAALEMAGQRVHLELHHQLTPEVAIEAAELQPAAVLCVDASVAVDEATFTPLTESVTEASAGHSLTPAMLLALMRRLYAVDAPGWLVQTPAADFGHGEGLSELAQCGVQMAAALASRLNERL